MRRVRSLWRDAFDIREGERRRTLLVGLYFVFVLFARNIIKPVGEAMFLNRFDIDRLPYLYLLIAAVGGLLAYIYARIVVKTSLATAIRVTALLSVVVLALFWFLIDTGPTWLLYLFNIFVSLFAIVFLSQGWLVAANIFTSREAKRVYAPLGLGAIIGGAFGGTFTAVMADVAGSSNLLPAAAMFVVLGYLSLQAAVKAAGADIQGKRSGRFEEGEPSASFTMGDLWSAVKRHRHLLVIGGIVSITFLVEVLVEFQFDKLAKENYSGDQLTAFLGTFNGVYLSAVTFVLQLFFTNLVVGHFGVGRTLLVAPVSVGIASLGAVAAPGLATAMTCRLAEASTRYSINRTAIELLYLPLPAELKNRTKTFVDVFVDRLGRGMAALLLLALTTLGLIESHQTALLVACITALWVLLALRARKEYVRTVRRRVESRRLDLEAARITVQDTETVRLLEQAARTAAPRQVAYALSLLDETPHYDPSELLSEVVNSPSPEVRAKVYQVARRNRVQGLEDNAQNEIAECATSPPELVREAVAYLLSRSDNPAGLASELVNHPACALAEATLQAMEGSREAIESLITESWLRESATSADAGRRALAALAVGIRGDEGTGVLHDLLRDDAVRVAAAACRAAGKVGNRAYLGALVGHLASPRLRGAAIEALTGYGEAAFEDLGKLLAARLTPVAIRRQIPRVFSGTPVQASVDTLERLLGVGDLTIRAAVLKALNKLRATTPDLTYHREAITRQIRSEAEFYYTTFAALERFRRSRGGGRAAALLNRTLETRLTDTIERLFRLLGLRYPPRQIYAAYLAVHRQQSEEFATALEFLDNLLDHELKHVLLPLFDGSPHLIDIGRETFGVEPPGLETALRQQIHSRDEWLAPCAMATAAELGVRSLKDDIVQAAADSAPAVNQVARDAIAALA